jgi:DNA polymerase-4
VTVRVRFSNLNSVTRSLTLDAPISATVILAEELVRGHRGTPRREDHLAPGDLCVASRGALESRARTSAWTSDEPRRPGTKTGMARWAADRAINKNRDRFGWDAIGTARRCWASHVPFPTSFASLPKRTCVTVTGRGQDLSHGNTPCVRRRVANQGRSERRSP